MNLNQEIRSLNSTTDLIENIVNHEVCCFPEDRGEIVKTVLPKDEISKKYFFILLLEIIAGVNKELIPNKEDGNNLIDILNKIACNPNLNEDTNLTKSLIKSTNEFSAWLSTEFEYDIYSANIGQEITINLSRKDVLYLIGNRCKHTLPRSNAILKKLVRIYIKSGVKIDPSNEILLLEDIDTWLLDDFGGYHFTKLCELCSNIYYSIYDYIGPEIKSRLRRQGDIMYSFQVPESLTREDEVFEFYELLNRFRSPWIPRINTWEALLKKY
ncbi:MAG: hypothetical protein V3U15_02530 [Nitrospinota bacterium]